MSYTGCLILEPGQKPHLHDFQWKEIYDICRVCQNKRRDNDMESRAVSFLESVYTWVKDGSWSSHRIRTDINKRILCLCRFDDTTNTFVPRCVRVSIKPAIENKKLVAQIDQEIVSGRTEKSNIVNGDLIYVPENIRDYDEIRRKNCNISRNFAIWFNLGGPQLQDYSLKEEE